MSFVSTVLLVISAIVVVSCANSTVPICSLLRCFGGPCCTTTKAPTTTINSTVPICSRLRCMGGSCCTTTKAPAITINSCGENMHHEDCGTSCPAYCGSPKDVVCNKMCNPGCFCNKGFVLDKPNGVCVRTENCPETENA